MNAIDRKLDTLGAALNLRAQRQQLLAANIANADTPGYKAVDIDFAKAVRQAGATRVRLAATQPGHVTTPRGGLVDAEVRYRVPFQDAIDGNTVEVDREAALFTENALAYQAQAQFLGDTIRTMRLAITGQPQ